MNKTALVNHIARQSKYTATPLTRLQVRWVITTLFESMSDELTTPGNRVSIEDFGIWECRVLKNKNHGHLTSNDGIQRRPTSEQNVITFRTSKRLRAMLK
ncbi:MAG: hypothetical protein CL607_21525 [Anaerolineaceae bacterium]|nr:hypothetical protein [Anaerolineaceae bacterium]MCA9883143.1 HU family DNA-binding protein [Anaerolineae bacterium]MCA9888830.1 HU family DNA-binding protein [Anaerolineae bacterium]MCA9891458.1 HU family DNA-binding protein [Anaerolineae bacterium]